MFMGNFKSRSFLIVAFFLSAVAFATIANHLVGIDKVRTVLGSAPAMITSPALRK